MAVFTHINETQLADFMAAYALPEVTDFKGIAAGVQNSNFIVETHNGKYILTIYEDTATGVNPDDLPYFLGLMQHLAAQGINCPTPIAQQNGTVLGQLVGRPAALVSFLPGRGTITPKPPQCRAVGAALAELHLAGAGFDMRRTNRQGPENWRNLFEASQARAASSCLASAALWRRAFYGFNFGACVQIFAFLRGSGADLICLGLSRR